MISSCSFKSLLLPLKIPRMTSRVLDRTLNLSQGSSSPSYPDVLKLGKGMEWWIGVCHHSLTLPQPLPTLQSNIKPTLFFIRSSSSSSSHSAAFEQIKELKHLCVLNHPLRITTLSRFLHQHTIHPLIQEPSPKKSVTCFNGYPWRCYCCEEVKRRTRIGWSAKPNEWHPWSAIFSAILFTSTTYTKTMT